MRPDPVTVEESDAATTYPLWRDVLRGGAPVTPPADPAGTFHLAARAEDGRVMGVVRFVPAPCPYRPAARSPWRLRGMATDPAARRTGTGRALVAEGLARVAAAGADLAWCHARTSAVGFYARMGFHVVTDEVDDPVIGPNVGMVIEIGRPAAGASRSS